VNVTETYFTFYIGEMAGVDMALLKELRAATNAPLKDCKQALEENDNNYEAAQEWLRQKWIMKAASKSDRVTKEGVVVVKTFGTKTVGVKLACETDFVARNETFRALAGRVLEIASASGVVNTFAELDSAIQTEIDDLLKANFVAIGENMLVADLFVREGTSVTYVHPGDKLVAVVFYTGDEQLAKSAAMQIAAMNPTYLSVADVPSDVREEAVARHKEEVAASGKPADIVEKIVEGKLAKEWSEYVLLEQVSILDEAKKVKEFLGDTVIHSFVRYSIG
jgi:elongation factor Ts